MGEGCASPATDAVACLVLRKQPIGTEAGIDSTIVPDPSLTYRINRRPSIS